MKSAALLLWLALFGSHSGAAPAAFPADRPAGFHATSVWVGAWLVGDQPQPIDAVFQPVSGHDRLLARLRFGEGADMTTEDWIGRLEGGRLRLSRSGVGEAWLSAPEAGRLVGRLSRLEAVGALTLSH